MPPVNMVDPQGRVVVVPEEGIADAAAAGYKIESSAQQVGRLAEDVRQETYGGTVGKIAAGSAGVLRGLTLGASDVALGALDETGELSTLKSINPITSTVGEIGGALAASFAAPGSVLARTPTGILSSAANEGVAAARALGGVRGFAGQAAITGAESAAQNVGSYLGSVALGDRDLTAEGLGGALGSGFAMGAAGGAAVYGIEKGSIAARRMFSQVMEGGDDAARSAAGNWERKSKEIFDANRETLDEAKRRLAEATAAVDQAKLAQQRAGLAVTDERMLAQRMAGDPVPVGAADEAVPPAGMADSAPSPSTAPLDTDPIAAMEARIRAGEVTGEAGPFSPEGLRAAAERELQRESTRSALGGFDFAPRTGSALTDVKKGGDLAQPAPISRAAQEPVSAAPSTGRVDSLEPDEFDSFKDAYMTASAPDVTDAGFLYSKGGDEVINGALRRGEPLTGRHAAAVDSLDAALEMPQARLPRDTVLYRGVNGKQAQARFANVKPGEVIEDPGYLSTASSANAKSRNESIVFNITAPAGTKGLPIPSQFSFEKEILLGRNTRMRVTNNELVPQVPTASRHTDAIAHEVLADGSVKVTSEYKSLVSGKMVRKTETFPPIREISVSIVDDAAKALPAPAQKLANKIAAAEDSESALMRLLQGTKAQIDDGATLAQVGAASRAHPLSKAQIEAQYDDILERVAQTPDVATKQALLREADALEEQLASLPKSAQALSEIDSVTQAMSRYERDMADLVDDVGDGAAPMSREMADAYRKAERGAEQSLLDRATQAIDDQADGIAGKGAKTGTQQGDGLFDVPAEQFGPFENVGPTKLTGKERVAYAKARKLEADGAVKAARIGEAEARLGYKAAQAKAAEVAQAARTVGLPGAAAAADGAGGASRAADVGSVGARVGLAGIPGDLPIMGPVIGMYLKARALKAGAERLMGRVPASGNAKVAALAAQTKDRAAHVVDKMLGYAERGAPKMRTAAAVSGPRLLEAVRERLYDDGNPAPAKGAGLQEHAAARSREISVLAADPSLIARQVRKEMGDVADPTMVAAAVKFRTNQIAYLAKVAPKEPPPSPFRRAGQWKPDKVAAADFARRYAAAMDPNQALDQVEQKCLTPEAAEAYRAVYPLLFKQTRDRMFSQAAKLRITLPRNQLMRMSILFDLPLDSSLEPANLSHLQGVFSATRPADQAPQQAPPVPSIAGPTNLTSLYQTASDRRAAAG
jgi:hypothetical protein